MMSQLRVFYPSGSSTAFTRSIGDRDTGGVNISKPEINSLEASIQVTLPYQYAFFTLSLVIRR